MSLPRKNESVPHAVHSLTQCFSLSRMAGMADLQPELLRQIICDTPNARGVCKGWLATHDSEITSLTLAARPSLPRCLPHLFERFSQLASLEIPYCSEDDLSQLRSCTSLTSLRCLRAHTVSLEGLFERTAHLPLVELYAEGCFTTSEDDQIAHPSLSSFELVDVRVGDALLQALGSLSALTRLSVHQGRSYMRNGEATVDGVHALTSGLSNLRHLDLSGLEWFAPEMFGALSPLNGLMHLRVEGRFGLDDASFRAALSGMPALQSLHLTPLGPRDITDDGIAVLRGLPMRELVLPWSTRFTDAGLSHVLHGMPLTSLRLRLYDARVTGAGWAAVLLASLTRLTLGVGSRLIGEGEFVGSAHMDLLWVLNIPNLSFFGLEYALMHNMPVLPNAVLTNLRSKGVEVKVFYT